MNKATEKTPRWPKSTMQAMVASEIDSNFATSEVCERVSDSGTSSAWFPNDLSDREGGAAPAR